MKEQAEQKLAAVAIEVSRSQRMFRAFDPDGNGVLPASNGGCTSTQGAGLSTGSTYVASAISAASSIAAPSGASAAMGPPDLSPAAQPEAGRSHDLNQRQQPSQQQPQQQAW